MEAFVEAASWAFFAGGHCYWTNGSSKTDVVLAVLYGPFEEAFAGLAAEDAVMEAGDLVAANRAGAAI